MWNWNTWETTFDREPDDPRKPTLGKRMKNAIQRFLVEVLPDPPESVADQELQVTFRISAVGDNEVFSSTQGGGKRVEIVELYFSPEGGANTIIVKANGIVLYPAQLFPNQAFFTTPPFELMPTQTIVLNLSTATSVVGRIRHRIESAYRHRR